MVFEAVAVFQQQQPALIDQFGQYLLRRIARIVLGKGHEQRIKLDRLLLHLTRGEGQRQQHAVRAAAVERFDCGRAGFLAQEQLQRRALTAQARQHPGEQERRNRRDHAHPNLARQGQPARLDEVCQLLRLAQHPVGLGNDIIAQRRKPHRALGPLDQDHAQQVFQIAKPG